MCEQNAKRYNLGYVAGTIRFGPHKKKEYMVIINCWSSDLSGAKQS